jgi:outer membrane protein
MRRKLACVTLAVLLLSTPGFSALAQGTGATQTTAGQADAYQLPDSYETRVRQSGAFMEVSLKDTIRLALTNNLEIAIEDFNEDLYRERIIGVKGFYDPRLSFQVGWESSEEPARSVLDAGQGIEVTSSDRLLTGAQLRQPIIGGGELSLNFNNSRRSSNSVFSFMNPAFGSTLAVRFDQPLWRGFIQTETERQLKITNLDLEISDSQFNQKVSTILYQMENQYWELVYAIENHETRRQAMEVAIVQYNNTRKRVEIGVLAPIEITQSRTNVATLEQQMIQSEVNIIEAQNALKGMLAPDPTASLWNLTMLPTDRPQMKEVVITMDDAIARALERRPEMQQLNIQVEKNEVDRAFYRKQGKPAFNLVAGLSSVGNAGRVQGSQFIDSDGDGVPDTRIEGVPLPSHPFYGSLGNALGQTFGFDYINYQVYMNVEIPLKNRSNDANLAQLGINERRLNSQMKNQQQQVIVEVRNAYESITTQKKSLEAARVARQLSEEQLAGETKRFEAGLSTNFEVLEYQRSLAEARVRELRALIDFQKALTALERAMYTIVDDSDIVLARRNNGN